MHRILVVDDEPDILSLVSYNLKKEGYTVRTAGDGDEALGVLKSGGIDLVVLDLMLPGLSGLEICRIVRKDARFKGIPIIMLTARGEEQDRVRGLEAGADDYLPKPFSPRELLARVKAVLRRTGSHHAPDEVLTFGDLSINRSTVEVRKRGRPLDLSATEFRLLLFLAERKGRVFSRDQLLDAAWKDETYVEPRTVDVHVRRLRMEIEDDPAEPRYIKTRRGAGYYFDGGA
jgi:phosphate regulon transcriptional regulator PhoB